MALRRSIARLAGPVIACLSTAFAVQAAMATNVVYVANNDPRPGQNVIFVWNQNGDGSLRPVAAYRTYGTGVSNPKQIIGPNDGDKDILVSPDGRLLFCCNGGSNSISVFYIGRNGRLFPVAGSPFPSGGIDPTSLALAGSNLYVVNKNQDAAQTPGLNANYTGFHVSPYGQLTPIPNSTILLAPDSSPTQLLSSPDLQYLFGMELFPGPVNGIGAGKNGLLDYYRIQPDGTLLKSRSTPQALPTYPAPANAIAPFSVPLNGTVHPTLPILYVNFVTYTQIGVYTYDASGHLTFVTAVGNSGVAPCWSRVSKDGRYLFVIGAFSNSVSTYSLQNPMAPVEIHTLSLTPKTAGAFRLEIDPNGQYLYVVDQKIDTNYTEGSENLLHILQIANDGTLSEAAKSPVSIPATPASRPQGIAVITHS